MTTERESDSLASILFVFACPGLNWQSGDWRETQSGPECRSVPFIHPSHQGLSIRRAPPSNYCHWAAVQGAVQCKGCLEALTTEVTRHFLYLTHVMKTTVGHQSSVKSRWNFLIKLINPLKRSAHNVTGWAADCTKVLICFAQLRLFFRPKQRWDRSLVMVIPLCCLAITKVPLYTNCSDRETERSMSSDTSQSKCFPWLLQEWVTWEKSLSEG